MTATVLLIGLGDLGSRILEGLAREKSVEKILVGSRNREAGVARCNLATLSAMAQGYTPRIEFIPLDLSEVEAVAELIHHHNPDVILTTATMLTWWLPAKLLGPRAEIFRRVKFGAWLPVHLAPTLKLMKAVREADFHHRVLTAPYPDVVNPVLARMNLAPTCGIGNIAEIVPKIRLLSARKLQVPCEEIEVYLVAHHALEKHVYGELRESPPPYSLRIEYQNREVTQEVNGKEILLSPFPIPHGRAAHFFTAGVALRLIRALFSPGAERLHAPGPSGLTGGYPIWVSQQGVKLAPIPGLSQKQAIAINEQSQPFDGIERIAPDGTVTFDPDSMDILHQTLGYQCEKLCPWEAEDFAFELQKKFFDFARKFGVEP